LKRQACTKINFNRLAYNYITGGSYTLRKEAKTQEDEEAQAAKETKEDEASKEVRVTTF
jgi:hypothetical protein